MRHDNLQFEMAGFTHTGTNRNENQDQFGIFQDVNLAVICDGMGGHSRGKEASELAVKIAERVFRSGKFDNHSEFLDGLPELLQPSAARAAWAWWIANQVLYQTGQRIGENQLMGTTGTLFCLHPAAVIISHVGDSRAYRLRGRNLMQLTTDHSWVNELLLDKEIAVQDVKKFEARNVITRALGLGPQIRIDVHILPWEPGDLFLLSTDGLTTGVNDDLIQAILLNTPASLHEKANELVKMALQVDGSDNITSVLTRISNACQPTKKIEAVKLTVESALTVNREIRKFIRDCIPSSKLNESWRFFSPKK